VAIDPNEDRIVANGIREQSVRVMENARAIFGSKGTMFGRGNTNSALEISMNFMKPKCCRSACSKLLLQNEGLHIPMLIKYGKKNRNPTALSFSVIFQQ